MNELLYIEIDIPKVREHLSREDAMPVSTDYVMQWLIDAGFEPCGAGWLVLERDLGQLQPSEVLLVKDAPEPAPSELHDRLDAEGASYPHWNAGRGVGNPGCDNTIVPRRGEPTASPPSSSSSGCSTSQITSIIQHSQRGGGGHRWKYATSR